ncbi:MAG: hypothetical protein WC334_06375 [Kiritimatiellales bacterium]
MLKQKIILGLMRCLIVILPCGILADQVQFNPIYTDADGAGFFDPTFGTARQTAFQYACGIWSGYLGTSYAGETINISASFTGMGGTGSSATLGSAGPKTYNALNFGIGPTGYLWGNAANANHWVGRDLDADVEISAQFNSDVDNSTVLGSTGFYYGLDGNCGGNIDFVSVLLHEIGHGLGFTSLINPASGAYYTLNSSISNTPSIYDYFLVLDNGDGSYNQLMNMSDADRLNAATSDALYWMGDAAVAANGNAFPKIYAPSPWEAGSSLSHEDETAHPNALMSPYYSGVTHTPDALTLGMLGDIGWSIIPEPSPALMVSFVCAAAFWIRRRFPVY